LRFSGAVLIAGVGSLPSQERGSACSRTGIVEVLVTPEQRREIARRLENWSLWFHRGRVGPRPPGPAPAYRMVNIVAWKPEEQNNLILSGEAEDTDRILRSMEPKIAKAIVIHYTAPSTWTPKIRAKACRCHVGTYYRRVEKAETTFWRLCYRRAQPLAFHMEPSAIY
jgi:hypothetical protein